MSPQGDFLRGIPQGDFLRGITLIDAPLLDAVSAAARASPRLRMNRNFHNDNDDPGHRLLNAIEPGSYIMPHRHLDPHKDETMVVLRGRMGLVLFDDEGRAVRTVTLGEGGEAAGVDILHGTWHSVLGLESGTVFLEAKAGPYRPLTPEECAPWAPAENAVTAPAYLSRLQALFD